MSLLALQRGFRDQVLTDHAVDPAALGVGDEGLAVYRHAYRAQLAACLRDTYEKTWSWLGDDGFDAAAAAHIAAHPPSAWTLADYGATFADTLAALYPDDPEVAELAWIDWALRRAFDGAGAEPVAPESLASVDWETAGVGFVPTLTVRRVETNCAAIWTALAEDETPPPPARLPEPAAVRVWRTELSPQYQTIEAFEADALLRLMAGLSFAGLCAHLAEALGDPDEGARAAGGLLGVWMRDSLIAAIGAATEQV